jgi:hypothetical protein
MIGFVKKIVLSGFARPQKKEGEQQERGLNERFGFYKH